MIVSIAPTTSRTTESILVAGKSFAVPPIARVDAVLIAVDATVTAGRDVPVSVITRKPPSPSCQAVLPEFGRQADLWLATRSLFTVLSSA